MSLLVFHVAFSIFGTEWQGQELYTYRMDKDVIVNVVLI